MFLNTGSSRTSICLVLLVVAAVHIVVCQDDHLNLWDEKDKSGNVVIPFMIDGEANFDGPTRELIHETRKLIEKNSCVRFEWAWKGDVSAKYTVTIRNNPGKGCSSDLGRTEEGLDSTVNFEINEDVNCVTQATVLRELLHVAGVQNQQNDEKMQDFQQLCSLYHCKECGKPFAVDQNSLNKEIDDEYSASNEMYE